jgi:import inner membrane translocase subunit TIM10
LYFALSVQHIPLQFRKKAMSFLGRGPGNAAAGGINADKIDMAMTEYVVCFEISSLAILTPNRLDTITDFFNRMVSSVYVTPIHTPIELTKLSRSCHSKCISARYAEAELNKGESICIDRCVAKFTEVQKKVGEKLQNQSAANKASVPGSFGSL